MKLELSLHSIAIWVFPVTNLCVLRNATGKSVLWSYLHSFSNPESNPKSNPKPIVYSKCKMDSKAKMTWPSATTINQPSRPGDEEVRSPVPTQDPVSSNEPYSILGVLSTLLVFVAPIVKTAAGLTPFVALHHHQTNIIAVEGSPSARCKA